MPHKPFHNMPDVAIIFNADWCRNNLMIRIQRPIFPTKILKNLCFYAC